MMRAAPNLDNNSAATNVQVAESYRLSMARLLAAQEMGRSPPVGLQRGAVIDLTRVGNKEIILVGDLHANTANLHAILRHNDNYERLRAGEIVLVTLGDELHESRSGRLSNMETSAQMLYMMSDLKWDFPGDYYCLIGTHAFLRTGYHKAGISQGEVFESFLLRKFGANYVEDYQRFVALGALAVVGKNFVAVHAGPSARVRSLADISEAVISDCRLRTAHDAELPDDGSIVQQNIVTDLTFARFGPGGYGTAEVRQFMAACGQPGGYLVCGHQVRGDERWVKELCLNHIALAACGDSLGYLSIKNGELCKVHVPIELRDSLRMPPRGAFVVEELSGLLPLEVSAKPGIRIRLSPGDGVSIAVGDEDVVRVVRDRDNPRALQIEHVKKPTEGAGYQTRGQLLLTKENPSLILGRTLSSFEGNFGRDVGLTHLDLLFEPPETIMLTSLDPDRRSTVMSWNRVVR